MANENKGFVDLVLQKTHVRFKIYMPGHPKASHLITGFGLYIHVALSLKILIVKSIVAIKLVLLFVNIRVTIYFSMNFAIWFFAVKR